MAFLPSSKLRYILLLIFTLHGIPPHVPRLRRIENASIPGLAVLCKKYVFCEHNDIGIHQNIDTLYLSFWRHSDRVDDIESDFKKLSCIRSVNRDKRILKVVFKKNVVTHLVWIERI